MRPMEKIISAELSFAPIETGGYRACVEKVLAAIAASGLDHRVGLMSTTVTGPAAGIFALAAAIYETMDAECGFMFRVTVSNRCGCVAFLSCTV